VGRMFENAGFLVGANNPETRILEHAANAGEEMIVTAAERTNDHGHSHQSAPVKAQLHDRRPDQATDKDEITAAFCTGQPTQTPKLAERDPVMWICLHGCCVGPSAQREQHDGLAPAHHRIGDRIRYRSAATNDSKRGAGQRIGWNVGALLSRRVARNIDKLGYHGTRRGHASGPALALVRRTAFASGLVPPRIKARTLPTSRSSEHFSSTRAKRSRNMPSPRNKSR